jgi:hypothetical protein
MAITVIDLSSALFNWLENHADAASTRALIQGAGDNMFEAGDLTPAILDAAVAARTAAGADTKALGISVQDAGEEPDPRGPMMFIQEAIIRIYDRAKGYRNIRNVRAQLLEDLRRDVVLALADVDGRERGAVDIKYDSRTGHIRDRAFTADWEGIVVRGFVTLDELD